MLARSYGAALGGVTARLVHIEAQVGPGLPGFEIVGLPDREVRESRVRVKAALHSCGLSLPPKRITVNLAPGDLRKVGTSYDLAIACAVLAASDQLDPHRLATTLIVGELGLNGELRGGRGAFCRLRAAANAGLQHAIVPHANATESSLVSNVEVFGANHLMDVLAHLCGDTPLSRLERPNSTSASLAPHALDLSEVRGQPLARRALEIAAAGSHPLLFVGPPGAGKSMLAQRLSGILPPLDQATLGDLLEIRSAAGLSNSARVPLRPFRAPHHSISLPALMGGGEPIQPGEVTLAHGGVLFLDELPEFPRSVIEGLRTTMETGLVHISRVHQKEAMPASPLIVAAMNPCPCGYAGATHRLCRCTPEAVRRYRGRISGPLLDRLDLHVRLRRIPVQGLLQPSSEESSATVRARVLSAHRLRAEREHLLPRPGSTHFTKEAMSALARFVDQIRASARSFFKLQKIARTIADLEESESVNATHAAEAIAFRALDAPEETPLQRLRRVK